MFVILLILSACSLIEGNAPSSSGPTPDTQVLVDTAVAATAVVETQVAFSVQQTVAAGQQGGQVPADTSQPPPPQPQSTNTPNKVTVTVSIDTNCRTGPGSVYDIIGALMVGQTAEVVGRSHNNDNWIIKLPSNPNFTCWLWAYYATTIGDTSSLPIIQAPPTPTPATVSLNIYNNCLGPIHFVYFWGPSDVDWGPDMLGGTTIPVGTTYSLVVPYGTGEYEIQVRDVFNVPFYTFAGVDFYTNWDLLACP